MIAERLHKYGHSYGVRCECGQERFAFLNTRQVMTLVAASTGHVRARMRRVNGWQAGFTDYHITPECDLYGIGTSTLYELQGKGLIETRDEEGPLRLTPMGRAVLDAIAALPGVTLPGLDTTPQERPTHPASGPMGTGGLGVITGDQIQSGGNAARTPTEDPHG